MSQLRIGPVAEPAAVPAAAPAAQPAPPPAPAPVASASAVDPVLAERERVQAIRAMTQAGEEELAGRLIDDGSSIGVATKAFNLHREEMRAASAAVRRAETPRPLAAAPSPGVPAIDPSLPLEQRCRAEWDRDAGLQAEFGGDFKSYYHFKKAESEGRLKNMGAFAKGKGTPLPGTAA